MPLDNVFYEFAALLALAALFGFIALQLNQPLIVGFVIVGILAGPSWLQLITAEEPVELLASMGISLLLFAVGLRLDVHVIRTTGTVALLTGIGQIAIISLAGFALATILGFSVVHALYVAIALTFSSTIIVVKLLSDSREIDSLHGRIAVGILIVQDIAVIVVMIGLSSLSTFAQGQSLAAEVVLVFGKAAAAIGVVAVLMRFALPAFARLAARSPELLVLAAVAWAFALAAGGDALGFSKEVGAFLAGVSLASTPFREALGSRLSSLRDFLLLFFFLSLGAGLDLSTVGAKVDAAIVLAVFVLIAKPLAIILLMNLLGYRGRLGFLAGVSLAQISEFSLILGALGFRLGHIDAETLGVITLVGLVTITVSSYMILHSNALFERLSPLLSRFQLRHGNRNDEDEWEAKGEWDCIVFGLGRYGSALAHNLERLGFRVLGIDFDPAAVASWRARGHTALYGDGEDPDFASSLPLGTTRCVVSTLPLRATSLTLLHTLRDLGYSGVAAFTARQHGDEYLLQQAGADIVLMPFFDAADIAAQRVSAASTAHRDVNTLDSRGLR